MSSRGNPTVGFCLGKPVKPDTVFPEVFTRLEAMRIGLVVHVPTSGNWLPDNVRATNLVVQRGLATDVLHALQDLEDSGRRCCNPVRSTRLVVNRTHMIDLLAANNIRTPQSAQIRGWDAARRHAGGRPVVIKAVDGQVGRGNLVLIAQDGDLPQETPFAGPYVVQEYIENDGSIYKLYVAGERVQGLRRSSNPNSLQENRGTPVQVDDDLGQLAVLTGRVLELDIYGVDVLYGPDGPAIVDVNPFPGFRGVPDGAWMIADHIASLAFSTCNNKLLTHS